jgi:antitoxin Phd
MLRRCGVKSWPVQDAKARFSEMLETCLNEGPQLITKRGADAAVLVPLKDWQMLKRAAKPTLKELLLADVARGELNVPERGDKRRRAPPDLVRR